MEDLYTHLNAMIRYRSSDMILCIESDAAYLVLPKSRIQSEGALFLVNFCSVGEHPQLNGIIEVLCKTIKNVVS